jgi:hypothetical protein
MPFPNNRCSLATAVERIRGADALDVFEDCREMRGTVTSSSTRRAGMPGRIEANRIFGFDAWSRETTDSLPRADFVSGLKAKARA